MRMLTDFIDKFTGGQPGLGAEAHTGRAPIGNLPVDPVPLKLNPEQAMGSFKEGTDHVPKTGLYKLHEGEAVIPKEKNMSHAKSAMDSTAHHLAGDHKPEKKIKSIHHRRGTDGSHIFEHHHHAPEHHPMEEHTKPDTDSAIEHFMQHGTDANPGEPEAEAGTPEQGMPPAAPAAGPAGPPAGAPPMAGM